MAKHQDRSRVIKFSCGLISLGLCFFFTPWKFASAQLTLPGKCNCQQAMDKNKPCAGVIIADTPSQTEFTIPSLWWIDEQFNHIPQEVDGKIKNLFQGKLITNWCADTRNQLVYLRVNRNLWSRLGYLGSYRLISAFGTFVSEEQYNLTISDQQNQSIATARYCCEEDVDHLSESSCRICAVTFESGFEEGFR